MKIKAIKKETKYKYKKIKSRAKKSVPGLLQFFHLTLEHINDKIDHNLELLLLEHNGDILNFTYIRLKSYWYLDLTQEFIKSQIWCLIDIEEKVLELTTACQKQLRLSQLYLILNYLMATQDMPKESGWFSIS